jgi:hypothetical protein
MELFRAERTGDWCYDFLNIFAEKFGKNIGIFGTNFGYFLQKSDHNIGFWEKRNFFSPKIGKCLGQMLHTVIIY